MSKAFTKESDGDDEDDLPEESGGLPVSAKNYMTPAGLRAACARSSTRSCARSGPRWSRS